MNGWEAVTLESRHLRVVVLPRKGAEIASLVDRASGVDVLLSVADGPRADDGTFHAAAGRYADWFRGAWHVMLPNGDVPCEWDGVALEHGGETWRRPFTVVERDGRSVTLRADLEALPLTLTRTLELDNKRPALAVNETLENRGERPLKIVWGEHPMLGPPLLAPGARLEIGPASMRVDHLDATTRLVPGEYEWPHALLRGGGVDDLSVIGGPDDGRHELALLHGLSDGRAALVNDALDLGFELTFDPAVFDRLWVWLDYGGADEEPWQGLYAIGLEPVSGTRSVAESAALGTGLALAPGEHRSTRVEARTYRPSDAP